MTRRRDIVGRPQNQAAVMSEQESRDSKIPELPVPEVTKDVKGGASKYIGETEKNLNVVLPSTKSTNASLLFNDGDDLFKR
jgi:hypothetical protein